MNNLMAEIVRHGENITSFSKKIGISKQSLSSKINGETEFKLSEIKKIMEFFNSLGSKMDFYYLFCPSVQNNGQNKGA